MAKKTFTSSEIQEYTYEPLRERVVYKGRWGEDVEFVFEEYEDDWSKPTGRYYRATYFRGATENQEDMFESIIYLDKPSVPRSGTSDLP